MWCITNNHNYFYKNKLKIIQISLYQFSNHLIRSTKKTIERCSFCSHKNTELFLINSINGKWTTQILNCRFQIIHGHKAFSLIANNCSDEIFKVLCLNKQNSKASFAQELFNARSKRLDRTNCNLVFNSQTSSLKM